MRGYFDELINQLPYSIGDHMLAIVKFLKSCGMHEIQIFLLLVFVPLFFLGFVTERIRNAIRSIRETIYWFVNGYYRVLYMMNPGFRTVVFLPFIF